MKARHLAALLAVAVSRPAVAQPHKLLVLKSEGRADPATRAKIDAAIVKVAVAAEPQASAGEVTFSDAATAVGCKPEAAACRDEVLGMLAVDEIVTTTVTPRPGGLEIAVHRFTKAGGSRDATMLLATGAPADKLDGITPLFGAGPAAPPIASQPVASRTSQSPSSPPPLPPGEEPSVIPGPTGQPEPPAAAVTPPPVVAARPEPSPGEPAAGSTRLELIGLAGGGGMVVLGLILWGAASSVQGDINRAPTATQQNLVDLKNLESKGDAYATAGNVLAIGGLVVAGFAGYFYYRDRRAASTASARIVPTVLDHGAGLVLSFGGTP